MTTTDTFKDIERLESDLWEAADKLRANSKLTSASRSRKRFATLLELAGSLDAEQKRALEEGLTDDELALFGRRTGSVRGNGQGAHVRRFMFGQ